MRISDLCVYPVKSCSGVSLTRASLDARGLRHDRHWMLIDPAGEAVTLRQCPPLAQVQPRFEQDLLILSAPGFPDLRLKLEESAGPPVFASIFGNPVEARLCPEGEAWFTALAGRPLRLVRQQSRDARALSAAFGGQALAFQDGNPLHLISAQTLSALNATTPQPVQAARFRANLVVSGAPAWAEDTWARVSIGDLEFSLYEPTQRCAIVNVALPGETADREPLRTLSRTRRTELGVLFGWNLSGPGAGELRVGDALTVLETRPSPFEAGPTEPTV